MRTSHSQPTTPCKKFWIAFAVCVSVTGGAWAQLAPNQTHGFGNNRLITFTYLICKRPMEIVWEGQFPLVV